MTMKTKGVDRQQLLKWLAHNLNCAVDVPTFAGTDLLQLFADRKDEMIGRILWHAIVQFRCTVSGNTLKKH